LDRKEAAMTAIAELLFDRPSVAPDKIRRLLDERAGALDLFSHGLPNASRQVADAIAGFLALPVGNLIFHAWGKHQAIKNACAQTAGRPGGVASVVVAEHMLETSQRPQVYIDIAGQHVHILDLVLLVTLHIDSAVVSVYEGRVNGCQPGEASATAELGVARPGGDSHPLVRRELRRVSLQPNIP
jgi:hypothetical protein